MSDLDKWLADGHGLNARGNKEFFDWGDWWLRGDDVLGEDMTHQYGEQICEGYKDESGVFHAPRFSISTLKQYVSLAKRFPQSVRIKGLTVTHWRAVMGQRDPEALRWLSEASKEGWTPKQLKEAMIRAGVTPAPKEKVKRYTFQEIEELVIEWADGRADREITVEFLLWFKDREPA